VDCCARVGFSEARKPKVFLKSVMAAERWPCSGVVFVDVAEKKVGFGMGNLIFLPLRKTRFVGR
jgi:hypothetical protein